MLPFGLFLLCASGTYAFREVFKVEGNLSVALVLGRCSNASDDPPYHLQTSVNSAIWITQRVNYLEALAPAKLGLTVYESCAERDSLKIAFDLYQREDDYILGVVFDGRPGDRVAKFCDVLDLRTRYVNKQWSYLLKASVKFLSVAGWIENVTVIATNEEIIQQFYKHSKREFICLKENYIYGRNCSPALNSTDHFVFFGNKADIEEFVSRQDDVNTDNAISGIFVPLDGSVPSGLPPNNYVIIPPHLPDTGAYSETVNIIPASQLIETAIPILTYVKTVQEFMRHECNETIYKINCVRSKFKKNYYPQRFFVNRVLNFLQIEPLKTNFIYNIYRVENDTSNVSDILLKNNFLKPFTNVMNYNIFYDNITIIDDSFQLVEYNFSESSSTCVSSFAIRNKDIIIRDYYYTLYVRTDAWVYAFLTLSLLGVIFCVTILIFLLIAVFKGDILEGNPVLTIALLLAIMLMFCSVLPFSIKANDPSSEHGLCLIKALSATLSYALVFSLLLSRCILLATASKEIGFMSHIAGPVQSFLWLFIFGVQAALSLQIVDSCREIIRNDYFVFIMSYNTMLLLLLLCLTPLVYKSQRNYREGKYFTIAICLTALVWCVWLPCYAFLEKTWKEPSICMGLVTTGAIFLGSLFIPRTYLMTIASARDKITSALPSLATAASAMDIYRANTQPIYDCVNVAAINAVTVARAGVAPTAPNFQQPDLYSCPALPEDENFDFRCDTPQSSDDKVTRF